MKRREFIALLGGTAAWPLAARAQQSERMRRIGVLQVAVADDPEMNRRLAAFQGELGRLGWVQGPNLRVETRWAGGDPERIRNAAAELVALAPDVLLVNGSSGMDAMQRATRTVPVVFVVVPDPVGAGYADSLARPGGNATGFAEIRVRDWSEMAGTTQGAFAEPQTRRHHSRSRDGQQALQPRAAKLPTAWRRQPTSIASSRAKSRSITSSARC